MSDEASNIKDGYLIPSWDASGNSIPKPSEQFVRDAADYIRNNFPELDERLRKYVGGDNSEGRAPEDMIRILAQYYKGLNVFTLMSLESNVRELLHPCGIDFSKLNFDPNRKMRF